MKVACIQFNPKLNERDENIKELAKVVTEAAQNGAKLIVTPEMATTGYHYQNREAIRPFVDQIPGATTCYFEAIAKQFNTYIVIGMPEVDGETNIYYNSAALIGPEGYIGKYRKTHQWEAEERWAAWGDLGIPVFDTEIGRIAINICMDSAYFESARIPAIQGADILAFITNSTAQTISMLQGWAETNGLYILSANRSNTEEGYHMIGASAVWSPMGEKLAEAAYIANPEDDIQEPTILYAEMDPTQYSNSAKKRLAHRRPELYQDLMLYLAPWDFQKSTTSQKITAAAIQYEPVPGNKAANLAKIHTLIREVVEQTHQNQEKLDLVLLPELAITGPVLANQERETLVKLAEDDHGPSMKQLKDWAKTCKIHLVFGWIEKEKDNDQLYNSAALINPDGELIGKYRKTHLNESDQTWATPGNQLPVFSTQLGRIGILIGNEATFPEVGGVMAVNRADILLVPSSWHGEFGREIEINSAISANPYPAGSVTTWNALAMGAQAYTLAANYIGTDQQYQGRSALYTLDPLYGLDQPVVASSHCEEGLIVKFSTLQKDWWFNQEKLVISRRPNFYKPLIRLF
jgi:predicted amidohydrolase